ncbi:MAG: 16S rRNA (cytidine(1402)-2'-O)-methyltransferase [Desulfuromonadales bacterium]|nr:16S rRNA (cytidine(1402)-2'-O)-methyltransferase [Desulfuromonadales bacterium]
MTAEQGRETTGTLYVVATPIGNLEDITYRAVRILSEVDLVAAEDTRHSRKLFAHFGIQKPLVSYHDHNEQQRQEELVKRLQTGDNIALISDAGTPCIADPGYRLIGACHAAGITVVPIPGPSALITALSAAGVSTERFAFEGYLPQKAKARADLLRKLNGEQRTLIFYETPHRLAATLADLVEIMGAEQPLVVARELTKMYEEFFRGTAAEAVARFTREPARGELVLVIPPSAQGPQMNVRDALRKLLNEGDLSRREAVKLIAKEYGLPSSDVYRESLSLTEEETGEEEI